MIFAASIIYFDPESCEKVVAAVANFQNAAIHYTDEKEGKMVIVIEGETSDDLENVRLKLMEEPFISDVAHYAFDFREDIEQFEKDGKITDFNIEKAFKKA